MKLEHAKELVQQNNLIKRLERLIEEQTETIGKLEYHVVELNDTMQSMLNDKSSSGLVNQEVKILLTTGSTVNPSGPIGDYGSPIVKFLKCLLSFDLSYLLLRPTSLELVTQTSQRTADIPISHHVDLLKKIKSFFKLSVVCLQC